MPLATSNPEWKAGKQRTPGEKREWVSAGWKRSMVPVFQTRLEKQPHPGWSGLAKLSSADKPHVSLKSSGLGEGLQSRAERSYGWCGRFLVFTDTLSKEAGQPSSQRQTARGNENVGVPRIPRDRAPFFKRALILLLWTCVCVCLQETLKATQHQQPGLDFGSHLV